VKAERAKIRKPKARARGGLTRAERTARLRSRPGYATAVFIPGGVPFTCREEDGAISIGEVEQAIFDATGKWKRSRAWLQTKGGKASLGVGDSGAHIGAGESTDPNARFQAFGSLDRGVGKEAWWPPLLAADFAGSVAPPFRHLVLDLWMGTVNRKAHRPRALDAAGALLVQDRKDWNSVLSAELWKRAEAYMERPEAAERNRTLDGLVQDARRQFIKALTDSAPSVWEKKHGKDWLNRSSVGFQKTLAAAIRQALALFPAADAQASDPTMGGFWRHYNEALRIGARQAKEAAAMFGLPFAPDDEGPSFSPARVRGLLQGGVA
jgi:hypothetical protein